MSHKNVAILACFGSILVIGSALPGLALAQDLAGVEIVKVEPMRFDGHRVVRAEIRNAVDLQLMEAISPDVWSEGAGIGPVDYRIPPERMGLLMDSGIAFEVLIEDLQVLIDAERGDIGNDDPGWYTEFHPLNEVMTYLDDLAAAHPDLATVSTIGTSIEGRDLRILSITGAGGPNRPTIVIEGNQHAREWITPAGTMYIAEELLTKYGTDPEITALVNGVNIYVVTSMNPDGYSFTWTDNRMWRKNRRDNGRDMGVDLNRNWATGWGGEGSSGNKGSDIYRGTGPFSEPETTAMRDFLSGLTRVDAFIDYHSYGQYVLQPWGYTRDLPADHAELDKVGGMMNAAAESLYGMTYRHGPAYTLLYPASGIAGDYPYDAHGALTYTIEMRDRGQFGFILPASQIIPAAEEGFAAFMELASYINQTCLELTVDNLVGGKMATFMVANAEPGGTVAILWSGQMGQFTYEAGGWCLDFGLDIPNGKARARLVMQGVANVNGVFADSRPIPVIASGMDLYFQAGARDTCPDICMSNVVSQTVQ